MCAETYHLGPEAFDPGKSELILEEIYFCVGILVLHSNYSIRSKNVETLPNVSHDAKAEDPRQAKFWLALEKLT